MAGLEVGVPAVSRPRRGSTWVVVGAVTSGWRRATAPGHARTAAVTVLGALVLLLAVLVGTGLWLVWRGSAVAAARADGVAAAMRLTPELLSMDYRSLPADTDRAEAATTGEFVTQYRTLMDEAVKPNASDQHLVTKATAREGALVSATSDRAVVLVVLSQVTTSKNLTAPRLDSTGVRVTLQRVNGQWLIAGLERV